MTQIGEYFDISRFFFIILPARDINKKINKYIQEFFIQIVLSSKFDQIIFIFGKNGLTLKDYDNIVFINRFELRKLVKFDV